MEKNRSIEQLLLAIKKEYELYEEVLKLSKRKSDLIINGEISELSDITAKEQTMILGIGKIEEIRVSIVMNIKKELGFTEVVDINDLADKLGGEAGKELMALRNDFSDLLKEVKSSNDLNGKLLQQSLEYIEFNRNLLSTIDDTAPIYNHKADDNAYTKETSMFDLKV